MSRRRQQEAELGSGTIIVGPDGRLAGRADPGALAAMKRLPEADRRLLQLIAISFAPIGLRRLRTIGKGLRPPLPVDAVDGAARRLQAEGFIQRDKWGLVCEPYWRDLAAQQAADEGTARVVARAIQAEIGSYRRSHDYDPEVALRDLRIAWLLGDDLEAARALQLAQTRYYHFREDPSLQALQWDGAQPVALPPIGWLPPSEQADWVDEALNRAIRDWQLTAELRAAAAAVRPHARESAAGLAWLLNLDGLLCGRAELTSEHRDEALGEAAMAARDLIHGSDVAQASKAFDRARRRWRREQSSRTAELPGVLAPLHGLALLGAQRLPDLERLCQRVLKAWSVGLGDGMRALEQLARPPAPPSVSKPSYPPPWSDFDDDDDDSFPGADLADERDLHWGPPSSPARRGAELERGSRRSEPPEHRFATHAKGWSLWLQLLTSYWQDGPCRHDRCVAAAAHLAEQAEQSGWPWLAGQCRHLGAALQGEDRPPEPMPPGLQVLTLSRYRPPWERSLEALSQATTAVANRKAKTADDDAPAERLTWRVSLHGRRLAIQGYLQKRGARGRWTKGRAVALGRLTDGTDEAWLTDADRAVLRHATMDQLYYRSHLRLGERAAVALVGHPLVFWEEQPDQPVELRSGQVRLRATEHQGALALTLEPAFDGKGVVVEPDGPNQLVVYQGSKELERVAAVVGRAGLDVPAEGRAQAREVLSQLAAVVPVHSDIDVGGHLEHVEPDARLYAQLARDGEGLRIQLRVRPFGPEGPDFPVARGAEAVIAEVDGRRAQTSRSLAGEQRAFAELVASCPSLAGWYDPTTPFACESLEESLALLAALPQLVQADAVVAEWDDRARARRFVGLVDGPTLRVTVQSADQWLALQGDVVIDDTKVAQFRDLLDQGRRAGRFVQLDDGAFVELSDGLRRELDGLAVFAAEKQRRGDQVRLHPAAALALAGQEGVAGSFDADRATRRRLATVREALAAEPTVPRTFTGELRPYQRTGYQWLSRLARMGLGACLADDMGLGKTIQVLALLLEHSAAGPALVVAPTSVCGNWIAEARRFTPTLRFIDFGAADRAAVAADLGPRDVLIASYALLAREAERLAAIAFEVAVLDEAQAIKNPRSQRARAAFTLQALSRVVATGTPVENRLGELYSIFRFLNPGLLGSVRSFNDLFARPIERHGDGAALARLRARTAPFILRRLKSEVLDELPARTEITIGIEAPPGEAALYEAIRQRAVDRLDAQRQHLDRDQRFAILAELTRLRRACCHPSLVELPDDAPASSHAKPDSAKLSGAKLDRLDELCDQLVDGGHRALVFSQFVDVLTLIRQRLDDRGLAYQYLDGSTPRTQRTRRVEAFQSGQGDVFLISTKAGGFGLNLTGADFVIHVDPWWNPAVEDQASDRAHRIGQTRPVTIYRLVMTGTIEEAILDLHHRKRKLAAALLADTDAPPDLDVEELLELLRH